MGNKPSAAETNIYNQTIAMANTYKNDTKNLFAMLYIELNTLNRKLNKCETIKKHQFTSTTHIIHLLSDDKLSALYCPLIYSKPCESNFATIILYLNDVWNEFES